MSRTFLLAAAASLCLAGAAAAQSPHDNPGFTPGPNNDASACSALWKGIGLPQYSPNDEHDTTLVCHTKYLMSHNNDALGPDWVIEHLTALVPRGAVDDDYKNSGGFDRGHQAPSADFNEDVDWMKESFILSNVVPQAGVGFNRDVWAKLEAHVRDLAIARGELYVIAGPIYPDGGGKITVSAKSNACGNEIVLDPPPRKSICGGKDQCDDGVIVPSGMFKLIYDPNMQRANVFLMPNINHRNADDYSNSMDYVKKFQVTVAALEQASNLSFFHDMPVSRRRPIEQACPTVMEP